MSPRNSGPKGTSWVLSSSSHIASSPGGFKLVKSHMSFLLDPTIEAVLRGGLAGGQIGTERAHLSLHSRPGHI